MRERPMLFSAPMVCAILDGRKSQTRRVVKPQPPVAHTFAGFTTHSTCRADEGKAVWGAGDTRTALVDAHRVACPYGQPGDRLWVREAWMPGYYHEADHEDGPRVSLIYRADNCEAAVAAPTYDMAERWGREFSDDGDAPPAWRPSIHMPRWASRITLEVTGVRVERLQAISEDDAKAEGCKPVELERDDDCGNGWTEYWYRGGYQRLWDEINGAGAWNDNPWVWVVEFKRVKP